jgi:alkanesulfonate monooxygenase SsuD/methylene tetrahydromethanopterin reductase-like flavin-dependent oxidoreductase (luciferase family)
LEAKRKHDSGPRSGGSCQELSDEVYFDNTSPVDIEARAEKEIPLESVYKDWTVSSDPEVNARAIQDLADLGATHVVVHATNSNQLEAIDFYCRKVIPLVQNSD